MGVDIYINIKMYINLQASLSSAQSDFEALAALDAQIKSFNVGANPYTWFTMEALEETWRNLRKIIGNTGRYKTLI